MQIINLLKVFSFILLISATQTARATALQLTLSNNEISILNFSNVTDISVYFSTIKSTGTVKGTLTGYLTNLLTGSVLTDSSSWSIKNAGSYSDSLSFANLNGSYSLKLALANTNTGINFSTSTIAAVPEPSSYALIGVGLFFIFLYSRRKKNFNIPTGRKINA